MQNRTLWWPLSIAIVLLLAVSASGANRSLFILLNQYGTLLPDSFWQYLTVFGDRLVALVLLLPFAKRYPQVLWAAAVTGILCGLATHGLKPLFNMDRPPAVLAQEAFHLIGPKHSSYSFPSGHSITAAALAGVWAFSFNRPWTNSVLLLLAVLIALSRVMVGVHWPIDILSGLMIGWSCAWVGVMLAHHWQWGCHTVTTHILVIILTLASASLFFHDHGYPTALHLTKAVAIFCTLSGLLYLLYPSLKPIIKLPELKLQRL